MIRNTPTKTIATPIITRWAHGGSVVARRILARASFCNRARGFAPAEGLIFGSDDDTAGAPSLQHVDQKQYCEGQDQDHQGDRGRALVVELFELGNDEQ